VAAGLRQEGGGMNLNSIMIGSEDPQRLADYYSGLFGKPAWEDEDFKGWQIGSGFVSVGPHDQVKGKNAHPGRVMWNIETSDVKGEFERLKAAGGTVVQEPYQPEGASEMWVATFSDPDDNYFQLMSPM
jgi:predicted enzyme related to lactoylglutathione lyase